MKYNIAFIVLFWLFTGPCYGQDSARILVRVRVQKEAVLLRWAAATPLAWKQTNRSGFRLERYTVFRDDKLLAVPEKIILGGEVIRAQPLDRWMPLLETNDNAGVIAQALYGDEFQLTGGDAKGLARIVNLAQELEQRFTFSLYAADQDFEVACMAGWGWRDATAKRGERYLYRIVPATPEDSARIVSGSVYTSPEEYKPLPRPVGLTAVWNDKAVLLSWAYGQLSGYYNSYYLEKSTDGKVFRRIPGPPVSNLNNKDNRISDRIVFIDSLPDNSQTFHYRVKGITTFGESGPASDTVSGNGMATLIYTPVIRKAIVNNEGKLELEWEFDERGNELITGFELRRSDKADGDYLPVVKKISPGLRALNYAELESGNYFTIAAVPFEGKARVSYPVLVQPLDTIPPMRPQGLTGRIDSLGKVTLSWNKNTEKDLLGYMVCRANLKKEEPYPLSDSAIRDTCFVDRVELANLNPEIYYYVIALDQRYNHSERSARLDLVKPDVIPPLSPLINGYHILPEGIEIRWIASPDADVAEHLLYRQDKSEADEPVLIGRFPENGIDRYVDTTFEAGKRYAYSVYAVDRSHLKSASSPAVTLIAPKQKAGLQQISRFDAVVDQTHLLVKLIWSDGLKNVQSYELYKSEGDAPVTLWKTLPGWQKEVIDERIAVGMKYKYMIRALFENRGNSKVKTITIQL